MGALCSCFDVNDAHGNHASDCVCPNCRIQRFVNTDTSSEVVVEHSSDQSSSPGGAQPTNAGPMDIREQSNVAMERLDKGTSHSRDEEQPIRQTYSRVDEELLEKEKILNPKSEIESIKILSLEVESGNTCMFPSEDDEDVCPTCLEEYHEENPKIVAKCSHHYHLSCIYEWMERSPKCPVCGVLMDFDESS